MPQNSGFGRTPAGAYTFSGNVVLEALRVVNQACVPTKPPLQNSLVFKWWVLDVIDLLMKSGRSHGLAKPHDLHRTDLPHREALR